MKITLKHITTTDFEIPLKKISHIIAARAYTDVIYGKNKTQRLSIHLNAVFANLPSNFLRINKSEVINLNYISRFEVHFDSFNRRLITIFMNSGKKFKMSRRVSAQFPS